MENGGLPEGIRDGFRFVQTGIGEPGRLSVGISGFPQVASTVVGHVGSVTVRINDFAFLVGIRGVAILVSLDTALGIFFLS